jgi:D-sedoheptulose 7-phosphate isomerase
MGDETLSRSLTLSTWFDNLRQGMGLREYLQESIDVLDAAKEAIGQSVVDGAIDTVVATLAAGKPLLVCGNGGSAADAMHVTGELVGRFLKERRALKAICLADNVAVLTAWSNDYSYETVFSRQVEAYGEEGAVLLGISTSGTSKNVLAAFETAAKLGMKTIALTGEGGAHLDSKVDFLLAVPSRHTPFIQQVHSCVYHYFCGEIEKRFSGARQ